MKDLNAILEEHVGSSTSEGVVFGRPAAAAKPRTLDVDRMTAQLNARAGFNDRLIMIIFIAYLAILAAVAFVVLRLHDTKIIVAALGGNLLTLAASVGFLRDIWREKNYIDMVGAALPTLPADQAVAMLHTLLVQRTAPKAKSPRTRVAAPAE